DVISLGSEVEGRDDLGLVTISKTAIRKAAQRSVEVLTDSSAREGMVDHNFNLGREFYSLESLQIHLEEVIGRALARER
ncbi:hypothetical protein KAW44_04440, partial [Candidatus Bipolaricaulota bacterium]|nr:hypothetical protein [Candidatus Bipolaricaulota bacterium]